MLAGITASEIARPKSGVGDSPKPNPQNQPKLPT